MLIGASVIAAILWVSVVSDAIGLSRAAGWWALIALVWPLGMGFLFLRDEHRTRVAQQPRMSRKQQVDDKRWWEEHKDLPEAEIHEALNERYRV